MTWKIVVAKGTHIAVYAFLAGLSAWVPLAARYRWLMMLFVMAHATATELLQVALHDWCHRGGTLGDVAFDQIGILLGAAVTWKWWTREDARLPEVKILTTEAQRHREGN